uniref:Uncharacterized protein n=1 Tax=Leersia perrieri TaxID=77586 RepID=A0A0D9VVN6_9ORYZ
MGAAPVGRPSPAEATEEAIRGGGKPRFLWDEVKEDLGELSLPFIGADAEGWAWNSRPEKGMGRRLAEGSKRDGREWRRRG